MDERQRRIEEKILRKEGELKALKGQLAELEKKEKEKAKREKQRWDQELLKQIDAVVTAARGTDFRLPGLGEEEKLYGNQSGYADNR